MHVLIDQFITLFFLTLLLLTFYPQQWLDVSLYFSIFRWYKALPPVTKLYGTACLFCTVACQIGLLTPYDFEYIPRLVFYNFQVKILAVDRV